MMRSTRVVVLMTAVLGVAVAAGEPLIRTRIAAQSS